MKKCVCCGEPIRPDEPSVPYKGRAAHQKCFDVAMKALSTNKRQSLTQSEKGKAKPAKPPAELKDKMTEEEYKEKRKYYDYLRGLIGEELMSAKVYAVSEDYMKRYKFSWKGMYQTLLYLNEILQKELTGDVVGLIPYYYGEAERFGKNVEEIEQTMDSRARPKYGTCVIKIKPTKRDTRKQIDITSVGFEENDG